MKHLIMGTAGHVDHGKTSLIKALTQIDCDTHKEEKRRGITINLGFSYLPLSSGETVGIIDVPGHRDFINTMVAGACGIDFVLLVIAADSGIMPQTIEHVNVVSLLGVKKAIVALTKIDLVEDDLAEMAKSEIKEYLINTPFNNAPIIGVSSTKGIGLEELVSEIEILCSNIEERIKGTFFRMYIDRIFSVKGMGSVVTGSVLNGEIAVGDELMLLPGNLSGLKIRSIEQHGKKVEKVKAGDRAAINLPGLKKEDVSHGVVLSDKRIEETSMIDVCISLFENEKEIPVWSTVIFLSGTYESQARMHMLSKKKDVGVSSLFAQIHLQKPAILILNDKFIIRNSSGNKTEGGGYIIDSSPLHHRKVTPELLNNLTMLTSSFQDNKKIADLIQLELKKELRPLSVEEIACKLHVSVEEVKNETKSTSENAIRYENSNGVILIHITNDTLFRNKVLSVLSDYHKANSLFTEGLKSNELFGKIGLSNTSVNENYLNLLLSGMENNGSIKQVKQTWAKAEHNPQIDEKIIKQIQWLENEILKYDLQKPVISEIEEKSIELGISNALLRMFISYLVREKKIYLFNSEVIHTSIVNKHKSILLNDLLKKEKEGLDSEEFRKQTGLSKRLCPILLSIYEKEKLIQRQNMGFKSLVFITKDGCEFISRNSMVSDM